MPANVDGMVREGISAYRAGRKDEARAFLLKAVEIDEHNEQAWLWLSAVVESTEEQQICLENVLSINPANERAKQGLQYLQQKTNPPAPASHAEDVMASASFAPPPPSAPSIPKTDSPVSPFSADIEEEELPSSIEWDEPPTATSSASSQRKIDEPSPAEYDDWVSGLNLGSKGGSSLFQDDDTPPPSTPAVKTNLEDVEKFISTSAFDEDEEDIFGSESGVRMPEDIFSGPFSAPETTVPPSTKRREEKARKPPAKTSRASARPAPPPSKQPDTLLEEIEEESEVLNEEFVSEFDDYDQATLEAPDPNEMFRHIPREIKATRLPGTNERYPILALLGFLVAIAANVGAVALLVSRLTGG